MRYATDAEISWCNKMRRLMKKMPGTMKLNADGSLQAVDSGLDQESSHPIHGSEYQPLDGISSMGPCEGGDPWN